MADLRATRRLLAAALALLVAGAALAIDCSDPSGPDWFWGPARGILGILLLLSPILLVYGVAKFVETLLSALGVPGWGNAIYPLLFIAGPMLVLYAYGDMGVDRAYGAIVGLRC